MTALTDLIARPLVPIELVIALAALAIGLCVYAAYRRLKGAWLRLGAALALCLALLDPALVREDREPLSDIVVAVVDESASQSIEDRSERTAAALAALEAQIAELNAAAAPTESGVELDVVRVAGDGARGTELAAALTERLSAIPARRLSASVLITDGAVSDAPATLEALSEAAAAQAEAGADVAPTHALITGRPDEFDRRIVVEAAPAFGLVGSEATLRFRVEQSGDADGAPQPQVTAYVDGRRAAAGVSPVGRPTRFIITLDHPGRTVVELRLEPAPGELTDRNNSAAFTINAVRDRLEVLLVSGEPHAGERTWRNLLKSDASVDLVHFTILRPPSKPPRVAVADLALIPFPEQQLFQDEINNFDLIIFDRYRNWRNAFGQALIRDAYLENIADFVREGGAVLVSSGPAFAGFESLYRTPLGRILPGSPTRGVIERPFRPKVTELGARHPVTRGLEGSGVPPFAGLSAALEAEGGADARATRREFQPTWGRWFRLIDVAPIGGDTIMEGPDQRPLLMLDRVGEGRVALLTSDHPWLWARGYDGGGPQAELLRRLAHWLMREPELEEEALTAAPTPGGFEIERRSLALGPKSVVVTAPDGTETTLTLTPSSDGVWRGEAQSDVLGVHRIRDADGSAIGAPGAAPERLETIAVVGPPAPREFADPVSTTERLGPLAAASGGAALRLADLAAAAPDLRRVAAGRPADGDRWLGLPRREAYEVRGVTLGAIAPAWLFFGLAALFTLAAWRVEGR